MINKLIYTYFFDEALGMPLLLFSSCFFVFGASSAALRRDGCFWGCALGRAAAERVMYTAATGNCSLRPYVGAEGRFGLDGGVKAATRARSGAAEGCFASRGGFAGAVEEVIAWRAGFLRPHCSRRGEIGGRELQGLGAERDRRSESRAYGGGRCFRSNGRALKMP